MRKTKSYNLGFRVGGLGLSGFGVWDLGLRERNWKQVETVLLLGIIYGLLFRSIP